jgi:F-type H+-transporting ATPase subunit b
MKNFVRRSLFAAFLAFAMGIAATAWQPAAAQSNPQSSAQSSSQSNAQSADAAAGIRTSAKSAGDHGTETKAAAEKEAAEKGAAEKEAAEDDGTAQFKQSPSVRWLGRHLGLGGPAMYWLAVVINFAIITLGVVYFSRLHLPTVFRTRTESIRKAMDEAKATSDDAKTRLAAIESRLGRLDSDIAAMRSKAEQDGAAEEARIRAAAEDDKQKIVEAAAQEIDVAAKAARRDLAAYAADLAVNLARRRIQVDVGADQALVSGFAAALGKAAQ